ncbi:MAG TPA: hypothetical protein VH933_11535 [Aestuariivirgaceae bacterium]|jgi:pimeloyl-ACP methyl ester carboxylesterase
MTPIARRLAASLPNIVHATISGVGHMAPVTHGELIAAEIANFIAVSGNSSAATSRVAA